MIPHQQIVTLDSDWKTQLRDAVTSPEELLELLGLDKGDSSAAVLAGREFPLIVPRSFISRMEPGNPNDPLLRQVLPAGVELLAEPGYSEDPVGETGKANAHPGIIQKYHGRVLLILSGGCAINCRYCFRRHFPYSENQNSRQDWLDALETIARDSSISEIILSGGDPLLVSDGQLANLIQQIATIPHVKRLRVHTRLPVVIPQRVTESLLDALCHPALQTVVVIHANHANEICTEVAASMQALRARDITVLNQAVLLAGVNDNADTLAALSERLFEAGVLPYYLHLLDKVRGAAHFDVSEDRGRVLLGQISARLPGYLVPRLVKEESGKSAKTGVPAIYFR